MAKLSPAIICLISFITLLIVLFLVFIIVGTTCSYYVETKHHDELVILLEKVCQVLNKNNYEYVIDFGTLLGVIRENDVIMGDADIDISMIDDGQTLDKDLFVSRLKNAGVCIINNPNTIKIWMPGNRRATGDIYMFKPIDDDKIEHKFSHTTIVYSRDHFFPAVGRKFQDKFDVFLPPKPEDHLANLYGNDYLTPKRLDKGIDGGRPNAATRFFMNCGITWGKLIL
jgi:hypothetical protein